MVKSPLSVILLVAEVTFWVVLALWILIVKFNSNDLVTPVNSSVKVPIIITFNPVSVNASVFFKPSLSL